MIFLSNKPDETGFYINQTTKVRVHKLTKKGVEVTTRSKVNKLGFIPYSNLTSTANWSSPNYCVNSPLIDNVDMMT
ncbi:MAG: hypothetical protein QJR05_03590, partial [Thermoanaerobacterium sp.]|nr:hypothetical protein [Thermoanaerobacterium sp.]